MTAEAQVPVDLDALYEPPAERIVKAVLPYLVDFHEAYLQQATFFCLATASEDALDASPRGGQPGFVHVLDRHTVAFADWPGNNRIESLRNLQRDTRVGMLFLFPGLDVFMRINGNAHASTDAALLARLTESGRTPKAATVVTVSEVLFHCGKAINRARLWDPASQVDRDKVPSVGKMMVTLAQMHDADVAQIDAHYAHAVKHELY